MIASPLHRRRLLWLGLALAVMMGGGVLLSRKPGPALVGNIMGQRDEGVASPTGAATPSSRSGVSPPPQRSSAPSAIQSPSAAALFTYAQPANAAAFDAALPAPTRDLRYVRLDTALIAGKRSPFWQKSGAGSVELPLPDGGALRVVIDDSEMLGANRFTSTGHLEGRPESRAVFAWNGGFLHASIDDAELGSFALRAVTEEFSQFYRVDPALVGACGGAREPVIDAPTIAAAAARQKRAAEITASPAASTPATAAVDNPNPQHAEVHVMMAYTQSVLATLTGAARTAALQSAFDAAIAKVNVDFAASQITARVKLVEVVETQYDENASASGAVQNDALTALYTTADGKMDELHAIRDAVGADLVCLALNRADFASTGLAFVLVHPGTTTNALFGFSVVQYGIIAGTSLVSHELGHNFGCAHDREHTTSPGAFPYSYGYRFTASDGAQYHDIMSYDPGTGLGYFSNPSIDAPAPAPAHSPGGIAPGLPGESDTSFTIEQEAFEVASYRLQTQTAASAGTLLNVSTRAFVGTGEQALIGGFVVTGPQAKKMLLRAAGPALGAFGVRDTLANPYLELYSGPTPVRANSGWTIQADNNVSAADVASAAAQAGAFPFASGSADAALLVTLEPGAYTTVIHGLGGTTGTALMEAYEVGAVPGANRIVNLSSRGYADNVDRKMYGGFVVSGPAGATKRILIRVLGPSLAKFKIATPMNDPYLELRNATGALLMLNDDWSSGTVAGPASPTNDLNPLVRFYNEQQIFATGFAPGNRREPCVLLDLPPGNYTVTVQPFEFRTTDPATDEPPQPGIALVEVYEIAP